MGTALAERNTRAEPETYDGRPVLWRPLAGFQERFCAHGAFEVLGGGAAGPGKTSALIALAAGHAAQSPNAKAIFLRTVYKDMLDVRDRMQALYPRLGFTWEATDSRWRAPSGGFVLLAHGATIAEIGPFLGPEYTGVFWDELSLVQQEAVWQLILSRLRTTDPSIRLMARASANPVGPGRAWLRDRFIQPCGIDGSRVYRDPDTHRTRAYVPGTSRDNSYLPQSYWDGLADLPPSIREALQNGIWDSELGMMYPELADPEHLGTLLITQSQLPPLLDWHEYWGSYDWGFVHPACFQSFVRIKNTVYWLDTIYMHRYHDVEQAATIAGQSDKRCLRTVYAGHDAFAKRMTHSAVAESVADIFARYSVSLERANIDRAAGTKAVRRFVAKMKPGPQIKDTITLRIVDTPGNRRAIAELQALVPEDTNPNVPAKRDANEHGKNGDDGADCLRYGIATPTFEPEQPTVLPIRGNVDDGVDHEAPWEQGQSLVLTEQGQRDRREYVTPQGIDADSDLGYWPGET